MARLGSINTATDTSTFGGGGAAAGFYATVAAVAADTIAAAVKTIRTDAFAAPGDGGQGLYARMAAAPAAPTNKAYIRSTDRYKADGTADSTNGGYWQLVPEGGTVRIEQFGGKGDSTTGLNGTDNLQPTLDAMAFVARSGTSQSPTLRFSYEIRYGGGIYRFSNTLEIRQPVWLRGLSHGNDTQGGGEATQLHWPNATCCIRIYSQGLIGDVGFGSGLPGSGQGTVVEGFSFWQAGTPISSTTAHGVHMRGSAAVKNCAFYEIAGDGINIAGFGGFTTAGGDCSRWTVSDCQVNSCYGHGLKVEGNDANAGVCINFKTHYCQKCGICDLSGLGNKYFGLELDGYGGQGVHLAGQYYFQISIDAGTNNPTTARQHWYKAGQGAASGTYPEWNPAKNYGVNDLSRPFYATGASNRSVISGIYVENYGISDISSSPAVVVGAGFANFTNGSSVLGIYGNSKGPVVSATGVGSVQNFNAGDLGYTSYGSFMSAVIGGTLSSGGGGTGTDMDLLHFETAIDGATVMRWENNDISMRRSGKILFGMTGKRTLRTFGADGPITDMFFAYDMALGDPNDSGTHRVLGFRFAQPAGMGVYGRGWKYFNGDPSPGGTEGWVCTQRGAIASGAWVASTFYPANEIRTNAGNYYRAVAGGTTAAGSAPVHTSGTVAGADGVAWTYVGNSAPVFKTFGSIAA